MREVIQSANLHWPQVPAVEMSSKILIGASAAATALLSVISF